MSDSEEVTARSSKSMWLAAALPVLFCLYVLSIGPAVAVWPHDPPKAVRVFYAPIIWLRRNTPLKKPIDWYADLWEGRRGPSTSHGP